ncbi:A Disintegrin And Metalloproteinase With Thrombospondin Motifs 1 [Manis pentadactyla]|nr:A Disintegrin And Metalloproteinase With Thrombospondin Motifs 1 [Manis pentadactyla]
MATSSSRAAQASRKYTEMFSKAGDLQWKPSATREETRGFATSPDTSALQRKLQGTEEGAYSRYLPDTRSTRSNRGRMTDSGGLLNCFPWQRPRYAQTAMLAEI